MSTDHRQSLSIGLLQRDTSWISLLDQMGVPWKSVETPLFLDAADFAVVIVNRPIVDDESHALLTYAENGGAVVYTVDDGEQVKAKSVENRFCRSLLPQWKKEYQFSGLLDLESRTYFFPEEKIIHTEHAGKGLLSFLGLDLRMILSDNRSTRRSFYLPRQRLPHEIVALRSKRGVRHVIQSHLEFLFHERNIPFIQKWFYPYDRQTIFTFRVDSDKGTRTQVDEIVRLSDKHSIPTTWFIDVKSHEPWLSYFSSLVNQEAALHCYEHSVYNSALLNKENFEKAAGLLRACGIHPRGIAAPTGAWNDAIGTAIRDMGMLYSSEFSYDYDNLPSYPVIRGKLSPVVQLPVHPMCIGTLRREKMTVREMAEYFIAVVDTSIALREPVALYHHPAHGTNEVFEEVFSYINGKKIAPLSYQAYAAWWNRRAELFFDPLFDGTTVLMQAKGSNDDTFVRISIKGNKETFMHAGSPFRITDADWKSVPPLPESPRDLLRTRRRTARHFLQDALDWWITTTE